ncbi:hypothetical protein CA13_65270 [Planctomycetes bacterium CA13]|uniref:Uncharacterized protein n=1 Tax=Novipirellula herctigrandis TaxID=2527986 RepID=A0A5C5ZD11_9BACT|nr:hypothetical protein CA13_65270 [Planctomycetes bacterium CA13]
MTISSIAPFVLRDDRSRRSSRRPIHDSEPPHKRTATQANQQFGSAFVEKGDYGAGQKGSMILERGVFAAQVTQGVLDSVQVEAEHALRFVALGLV